MDSEVYATIIYVLYMLHVCVCGNMIEIEK